MKKSIILIVTFVFFTFISSASAQLGPNPFGNNANTINLGNNQPYGVPYANTTVGNLVANALQIMYIFAALAVLVFLVWGAFDWITSGGDKEKVSGARKKITNALIGLALLALAGFIVVLFGEIVGLNPFNMGLIPTLGQQPQPIQPPAGTTP